MQGAVRADGENDGERNLSQGAARQVASRLFSARTAGAQPTRRSTHLPAPCPAPKPALAAAAAAPTAGLLHPLEPEVFALVSVPPPIRRLLVRVHLPRTRPSSQWPLEQRPSESPLSRNVDQGASPRSSTDTGPRLSLLRRQVLPELAHQLRYLQHTPPLSPSLSLCILCCSTFNRLITATPPHARAPIFFLAILNKRAHTSLLRSQPKALWYLCASRGEAGAAPYHANAAHHPMTALPCPAQPRRSSVPPPPRTSPNLSSGLFSRIFSRMSMLPQQKRQCQDSRGNAACTA